ACVRRNDAVMRRVDLLLAAFGTAGAARGAVDLISLKV
ncbi:hypothetical protein A2U01_0093525, partial [Trifolium medium]|nr:hypothetical protein [Trifolium medium]